MNRPFTNNTDRVVHIGTKTIFPGDTREVEERHIPPHLLQPAAPAEAEAEAEAPDFDAAAFIAQKVDAIREQVRDLSTSELDAVAEVEQAANKRKGVFEAIAEERLRRATNGQQDQDMEAYAASLREMSDDELEHQLEQHQDQPEYEALAAAVVAEQKSREGADD